MMMMSTVRRHIYCATPCLFNDFSSSSRSLNMPPKQSNKTEQKQKQKIIEDKTFGLKNKNKSKKVAAYVQQVQKQVQDAGKPKVRPALDPKVQAQKKKEEEAAFKQEIASLVKPVHTQKVAPGVDPKSVLCQFFKAGICEKGAKCKFSHDLTVERKAEKINLYTDVRKDELANESMEKWDQATLEQVISMKQKGKMPDTDIVCKYFLDAVEKSLYGFFWECPNGDSCHYRHALPMGYVLKKDKKKDDDEENKITIEEFIEIERKKLTGNLIPVTVESFAEWKKARKEKKAQQEKEDRERKEAAIKAGKALGGVSGRDLFAFKPELFVDDDEAGDANDYIREENDENDDEPRGEYLGNDNDNNEQEEEEEEERDEGGPSNSSRVNIDANLFNVDDLEDDEEDEQVEQEQEEEEQEDEEEEGGASSSRS